MVAHKTLFVVFALTVLFLSVIPSEAKGIIAGLSKFVKGGNATNKIRGIVRKVIGDSKNIAKDAAGKS
ncbi:hypothetical protein NPIL_674321 [Nephila pilipes]|uniref:Uncharacterized protein n=1 Tax=Nephila pilipes TaxID=299642 RepID=A0A8X6TP35_NEPPI|nr:hypothetical protein NPIL_674321 [Nephila pilipes]